VKRPIAATGSVGKPERTLTTWERRSGAPIFLRHDIRAGLISSKGLERRLRFPGPFSQMKR
jgi:hypothetical protein